MTIKKVEELERELNRQRAYVSISAHAATAVDTSSLLSIISEDLPKVLDVTRASIALFKAPSKNFEVFALGGAGDFILSEEAVELKGTAVEKASQTGGAVSTFDYSVEDFCDWVSLRESQSLHQFIVSPLITLDGIIGTFNIGFPKERDLTIKDIKNAAQFSQVIATNLRMHTAIEELQQSMDNLKYAQDILVEQAKLAALGNLVAGLAHEVNTPLGVALTASSITSGALSRIGHVLQSGAVSRRTLMEQIGRAEEGIQLTEANLNRAANLIREFKRLAVDQSRPSVDKINVIDVINSLSFSLVPMTKEANIHISISGEEKMIVSESAAIQQVMTNLIQNACVHAYDEKGGNVFIEVSSSEKGVTVKVKDEGVGMMTAISNRIFEPFFTTRRGEGGTGLGLYIVQNLMRGPLKGDIFVKSQTGLGAEFTLELPSLEKDIK